MQIKNTSQIEVDQEIHVIHKLAGRSRKEKGIIYFSGIIEEISGRHGCVLIWDKPVHHKALFWYTGEFHDDYFVYDKHEEAKQKIREIFEL